MIPTSRPFGSPVSRSSPIEAPSRLPVWNAALPIRMVTAMRPSAAARASGFCRLSRMASARPRRPARPTRAAMFCSTTVAITENSTAQRRAAPYPAPARLAVTMVPGPMKAAVTRKPGPTRKRLMVWFLYRFRSSFTALAAFLPATP